MRILRGQEQDLMIIDPSRAVGEPGRCRMESYVGQGQRDAALCLARAYNRELRRHFGPLTDSDTLPIPLRIAIEEIPPGHVQPFHANGAEYEVVIVLQGTVLAVESETLTEENPFAVFEQGILLHERDMLVEELGVRYTIANLYSDIYAVVLRIHAKPTHLPLADILR